MVIEVYGCSGSGKSTLVGKCIALLKEKQVPVCSRGEAHYIGFSRRMSAWAPIGGMDTLKHRLARGAARCAYPTGYRILKGLWPSGYCMDRQALLAWFITRFGDQYDWLLHAACSRAPMDRARRQRIQQLHADCMLYANLFCTPTHHLVLVDEGFLQKILTVHALDASDTDDPLQLAGEYLSHLPHMDAAIWVHADPATCLERMRKRGTLMDAYKEGTAEEQEALAVRTQHFAEMANAVAGSHGIHTGRICNNSDNSALAVQQMCAFITELSSQAPHARSKGTNKPSPPAPDEEE